MPSRFISSSIALVTVFAIGACSPEPEPSGPVTVAPKNLLFVVLDTTRVDHLSTFGYDVRPTSPRLDELAATGLVMDRAYAHSSLTPVSAGSFLTGVLPHRHGVRSLFTIGKETLQDDIPSLFGMLGESGRTTAGFVSAKPMGSHYGLNRGFDLYEDDLTKTKDKFGIDKFGDAPQRPGDATTGLALDWLDANGKEPFAMMVHLFDAHDLSFLPPRKFVDRHLGFALPKNLNRRGDGYQPKNLEQLVELYDTEIRFTDRQLGLLLKKLDELGVRDETLVVVLADHGEAFGEHDVFTHGWLYEEQLRVPLVINGPGVPAGVRLDARVRLVDLFPTLAQLFDLPLPDGLDGESVLSMLNNPEAADRDLYAEVHHAPRDPRGREAQMFAVISKDWKYIHHPETGAHELYSLSEDAAELNNRFADEPRIAAELLGQLMSSGALGGEGVNLDGLSEQQVRELQSLGYLGDVDEDPSKQF